MGLQKKVLKHGNGTTFPKNGQSVVVHYNAYLAESGKMVDSSRDRDLPFKFHLGKDEVCKGWEQGVSQMSLGERAKLTCSSDLAYGEKGFPGVYP